jgi:hypothetical protein
MYRNLFYFLSLIVLLSGCATKRENLVLGDAFLQTPSTVVIVEVSGLEKPSYRKDGDQGLLDVFINEAFAKAITKRLETIDVQRVLTEDYYKVFSKSFSLRRFKVVPGLQHLSAKELGAPPVDKADFAPHDFRGLKEKYGAGHALILQPIAFGLTRSYYSFIPLGAPQGYVDLTAYVVDLTDNSLEGYFHTAVHMPVEGKWDEGPEYVNLMEASKHALTEALNQVHNHFFTFGYDLESFA